IAALDSASGRGVLMFGASPMIAVAPVYDRIDSVVRMSEPMTFLIFMLEHDSRFLVPTGASREVLKT
ncbi:MAG: hypothetical protein AAB229_02550, partial [Candidatus Hydrogenedentota bacterium]